MSIDFVGMTDADIDEMDARYRIHHAKQVIAKQRAAERLAIRKAEKAAQTPCPMQMLTTLAIAQRYRIPK